MVKKRVTSKFKQTRSTNTRQKIIDAAEHYFCQNGYYNSSVKKLAAAANVSIGSFYFYFKGKDELWIEVYRTQNERFVHTIVNSINKVEQYKKNRKSWLHEFIMDLLKTYGNSCKMRAEMKVLNYGNPKIAGQRALIKDQAMDCMMESFEHSPMMHDLKVKNPRIALSLITDIMDSTYERITSAAQTEDKESIIEECCDAIYKYLLL